MQPIDSWKAGTEREVSLLRRCKSAIREVAPEADVILFGSRARGDPHEYSDYDLIVLVDGPATMALEDRIHANVYPIQLDTDAMFTLIVFSRREWDSPRYRAVPLHENVQREGVLL